MSHQSKIRSYVIAVADRLNARYQSSSDDALAEIATRLSDDEVVTDDIEDLIVTLRRVGAISGAEMVDLLGRYLAEKPPD